MLINTRDFGEVEVDEEYIYDFPLGVYGFETAKQFALLSPLGENTYPMWLQCTTDISPCFIVFDPLRIDLKYKFTLTRDEEKLLRLDTDKVPGLQLLAIAKVPEEYHNTTVNMKSPVVVNTKERVAAQVILPDDYSFRLAIYDNDGK